MRRSVAPGMGAESRVKVSYWSLLEVTVSRRQLHEAERAEGRRPRGLRQSTRDAVAVRSSARSCGMEARGVAQHRTKVKLRKADGVQGQRAAQRDARYPDAAPDVVETVRCEALRSYPGRSPEVPRDAAMASRTEAPTRKGGARATGSLTRKDWVAGKEATTTQPRLVEKSDHLVVVMKPGNSGGAKGVTR